MSFFYVLIPLFPLLAAIVIAFAGRGLGEKSGKIGMVAVGISFGLSVAAFVQIVVSKQPISIPLYEFFRSGELGVDLGLYIDQLTVLMLLLVTGGSFVVHVYSGRYMIGDARYSRFFSVIALLNFGMVALVMSSNLLTMFIYWEIMGICSYLLISHQSDRESACKAATKAFLVNAIADVGLLFGIILTFATFETLDIRQILELAPSKNGETINLLGWAGFECHAITVITLFLFMGCLGKSAQLPFHVWLPNAMEAPTPVSALIHAATMVNAGPFLLVRLSGLFMLSPVSMTFVAIAGGTTALFAAIVSLTQTDIKKMLAYSTISQIGFMIMACGVGAFAVAIFHMLAHGCLKGFLFLSTGNQLESTAGHHYHEPSSARSRPSWMLYLGTLILACIPPFLIFSGPYEALWTAQNSSTAGIAFWVIGLLTVFFSAMYLFRGVTSLFGQNLSATVQPQLFSPSHLLGISLGGLGLTGILVMLWVWFTPFLGPAIGDTSTPVAAVEAGGNLFPFLTLPLLVAFAGWALAYLQQVKPGLLGVAHSNWSKTLYVLFLNKFYVDEIYSTYLVRPLIQFSRWLCRAIDVGVIDRLIRGTATSMVVLAKWMWRVMDVRGIDRAVLKIGSGSLVLAKWLWQVIDVHRIEQNTGQTGPEAGDTGHNFNEFQPRSLQHHLLVFNLWLVAAIVFFYWVLL